MSSLLDGLNEPQRQAAECLDGPLLIHAPVGTGKTTVLAHRAALAIERGRDPARILCISFTNRAGKQMRDRMIALLGGRAGEVTVRTFHSFCTRLLRLEADTLGLHPDFTICDEADAKEILLDAWQAQTGKAEAPPRLADVLVRLAARLKQPYERSEPGELLERLAEEAGLRDLSLLAHLDARKLVEEYSSRLFAGGTLDFADLILRVHQLLQEFPDRLAHWQQLYPFIQVDEVQDVTPVEFDILLSLASASRNIALFGDLDQTIYEWRGSSPWELLPRFRQQFAPVREVQFHYNYRATRRMLDACLGVVRGGPTVVTQALDCSSPDLGKPVFVHCSTTRDEEGKWIVETIGKIRRKYGIPRRDVAVLVRSNREAAELSTVFSESKLDHYIVDPDPFFRQPEIKDAIALARCVLNPLDSGSLRRVLQRGTFGVAPEVVEEIRRLPPTLGLRLIDFVEPRTFEDLDPFGLLLQRLEEGRVVVFDTETTGLDTTADDIVELAAQRDRPNETSLRFHALLRTERSLEDSTGIHGITPDLLAREGRDPTEVLTAFLDHIDGCILAGHNVAYDLNMLRGQLHRLGLRSQLPPSFDTLDLCQRFFALPRYTLTALCRSLSIPAAPSHRAQDDVAATWLLLHRLLPRLQASRAERRRTVARYADHFRRIAEQFAAWRRAAEDVRPNLLVSRLLDESGLLAWWDRQPRGGRRRARLMELGSLFGMRDDLQLSPRESLLNLSNLAALGNEMDRHLESEDKVLLLTAHQAKGLEFDTVFIAGASESSFPSPRAVREGRVEEERRLFYVAMTRARQRLIITGHRISAEGLPVVPSRFLDDLPVETRSDVN